MFALINFLNIILHPGSLNLRLTSPLEEKLEEKSVPGVPIWVWQVVLGGSLSCAIIGRTSYYLMKREPWQDLDVDELCFQSVDQGFQGFLVASSVCNEFGSPTLWQGGY